MTLLQDELVHLGYTLMLLALLARDILWLRGVLVLSQSTLAWYAFHRGVTPIAFWNLVFVLINSVWVLRILRERAAVVLPAELRTLYERHFAALSPPEFLRLWSWGERGSYSGDALIAADSRPAALYFILAGEVLVSRDGRELTRLHAGDFVGEMSLLTGEPATADAHAGAAATLMRWPTERLAEVRLNKPLLWTRLQSVLGHDLVEKLRRASVVGGA